MGTSFSNNPQAQVQIHRYRLERPMFREWLNDTESLMMLQIPTGEFVMGSPDDESDRSKAEGPQHRVHVSEFWMSKYPITQSQWRIVAGFPEINRSLNPDPSHFKGDNHPVEQVSWYDAVEFCDRLSAYTERPYRLPSEAEWEYACRAGTKTPFHFGETITTDLANFNGQSSYSQGSQGKYQATTTEVTAFNVANAYGLCDMHGNVFEWCLDNWHDSYEGAPSNGSIWSVGHENSPRVRRGGSWYYSPSYCRSAFRSFSNPDLRYFNFGFRVVCTFQ